MPLSGEAFIRINSIIYYSSSDLRRPFGIREGQKARIMERAESVKMAGKVIIRLAFVRGERF